MRRTGRCRGLEAYSFPQACAQDACYSARRNALETRAILSLSHPLNNPHPPFQLMSLLTMMAAYGPALDALDAALDADRFGRILAKLSDQKIALGAEMRASFAEFVADVARLDSWKGVTVAISVRSFESSRRVVARKSASMSLPGVQRKQRARERKVRR